MSLVFVSFNWHIIGVIPWYDDVDRMTWNKKAFKMSVVSKMVRTMGFSTIKEYLRNTPGYDGREEPTTVYHGRRGGEYRVKKEETKQGFTFYLLAPALGANDEYKDGSKYSTQHEACNRILKDGYEENEEFMFIPGTTLKEMHRKSEFKHLGDECFWYCDDWKE